MLQLLGYTGLKLDVVPQYQDLSLKISLALLLVQGPMIWLLTSMVLSMR